MQEDAHVSLELLGIVFKIHIKNEDYHRIISEQYKNFLTKRREDYFLSVDFAKTSQKEKDACIKIDKVGDSFVIGNSFFRGTFYPGRKKSQVTLFRTPLKQIYAPGVLSDFLATCYSILLLDKGYFILHSSGLVKDRKGYIFCGQSGAGKTTIAEKSGAVVLNDDFVFVKASNGKWNVYGTPFSATFPGVNKAHKLDKIFLIKHAKTNYTRRLKKINAIGPLLSHMVLVGRMMEGNYLDHNRKIFNLLVDIVKSVPVYWLGFTSDCSFLGELDEFK